MNLPEDGRGKTFFDPSYDPSVSNMRSGDRPPRVGRKQRVLEMCGGACAYCGLSLTRRNMTIDHVVPRVRGGSNSLRNLVAACFPCNNGKADTMPSVHPLGYDLEQPSRNI